MRSQRDKDKKEYMININALMLVGAYGLIKQELHEYKLKYGPNKYTENIERRIDVNK